MNKYKQKYLESDKDIMLTNLHSSIYSEKNDEVINYVQEKALIIDSYFNSPEFLKKYKLDISTKLCDIKTIFNQKNYIQLRPYQGEKVLVISYCCSKRIDANNLLPYINTSKSISDKINCDAPLSHNNQFIIDISLIANPSIIAKINSTSKFPTIPNHSFNLIYFEESIGTDINIDEIKRLLNNKTNSFCIMIKEGDYHIHSYYTDDIFFIIN